MLRYRYLAEIYCRKLLTLSKVGMEEALLEANCFSDIPWGEKPEESFRKDLISAHSHAGSGYNQDGAEHQTKNARGNMVIGEHFRPDRYAGRRHKQQEKISYNVFLGDFYSHVSYLLHRTIEELLFPSIYIAYHAMQVKRI